MTNPENLLATKHGTAQRFDKCRSCGARVMWVKTPAGKYMPVDVATDVSHFATCPQAGAWRRSREARKAARGEATA